jgi:FAD synthase
MNARTYTGIIIPGSGRASTLGFPTINIPLIDGSLSGIYAGKVFIQMKTYIAAVYADQRRRILEAHLIDFPKAPVTGQVTIELRAKVREDRMFLDDDALKAAIVDDIEQVRALTTE